ncbi:MAG: hypothetical protein KGM17_06695 [Sphingomonadales bacterium]|nr:hypothetical protein [Sphingomonadales bacterium]
MAIDRAAALKAREEARTSAGPLAARVFRYNELIEQVVNAAKQPGFTPDAWKALEEVIDPVKFERVGNFKEVMDWPAYVGMLTAWGTTTEFWSNFRRISESGNCVFLELEEHNTPKDGKETVVNSLSLYEFDTAGKIIHLDIYLQMAPG